MAESTASLGDAPLAGWHFTGTLRTYQAQVLERLAPGSASALHIVAPPGSGKTLLGLLLAAREGGRTLVLAPSTTIREQWARTAAALAPDAAAVSTDPLRIGDLTALTYQALSVTGDGSPFEALARARWADELVDSGRTQAAAETWLAELAVDNPAQYRTGLRGRVKRIRRRFTRERPQAIARVLHPNAVALLERIVDAGVDTIVLDECHHLLDHWALVVAYLVGAIRERGGRGLVIGLTATLPDVADGTEFDNYTQLLGDVDFEVPTPAVVKEGHLAPYRDHVWFTEPVPAEAAFIRRHGEHLDALLAQVLSTPDGIRYLEERLQPADPDPPEDPSAESAPAAQTLEGTAAMPPPSPAALERALADDLPFTRSCGVVLRALAPQHPLCAILPPVLFERCTTDDLLTVLARFALTRLLPDPGAKRQWRYVKKALADFGLLLTDRGLRRGRDPVETTLAFSEAKDRAAVDILRLELSGADGARVKAVIVTDFVEHGNSRGLVGETAAGALRAYDFVVNDPLSAALNPVLLTADRIRVPAARAEELAGALAAHVGSAVQVRPGGVGPWRELDAPGVGSGRIVAAVSALMSAGSVRLLVGTRGLLGEGWDCPAVNTLIDLTTVTTSTGAPQLRGRTLRLDPAWPEKVAHNWSVSCLIPADVALDDATERRRLIRRHGHLLGLSADDDRIVRGLGNALSHATREALDRVLGKDPGSSVGQLGDLVRTEVMPRSETRTAWRVGEPYVAEEREALAVRSASVSALVPTTRAVRSAMPWAVLLGLAGSTGITALAASAVPITPAAGVGIAVTAGAALALGGAVGPLVREHRRRRDPAASFRGAAVALTRALAESGRIRPWDEAAIIVRNEGDLMRIELSGPDRRVVADAMEEIFAPPSAPRFLLRTDRDDIGGRASLIGMIAATRHEGLRGATFLAIPRTLARRRTDAEAFLRHWRENVGAAELIELKGEEGLALLALARRTPRVLDAAEPRTTLWG
ncbi:DEAD/DEAH box helicase family protein [Microbacterium sp. NPDC056052]|uniref:DEAD/DEAH box helicase family protein n=1 Tax=Microbacterium sp. NPDC056052 TaxID=3345695 RepID=UPI0035E04008